ncbi:hypothetical protein CH378_12390 [Leptospira kmetyi]|uniref:Lipoprotein n=2 Tax=Leptospira kmetyi TaxID=408139 RepID=A0ABX4N876_9LEPT|nr:hypothetical protein CH378_12390 [Leptospira kmetyi]
MGTVGLLGCIQENKSDDSLLVMLLGAQVVSNCSTPQLSGSDNSVKLTPYQKSGSQYMGSLGYLSNYEFGRRIHLNTNTSNPSQYLPIFYNANSNCEVPQDYSKSIGSYSYYSAVTSNVKTVSTPLSGNLMMNISSFFPSKLSPTDITVSIDATSICKTPTVADSTQRALPFDLKGVMPLSVIKINSYAPNQEIVITSTTTSLLNLDPLIVTGSDACYPQTFRSILFTQTSLTATQASWSSSTVSGPLVILLKYPDSTTVAPNDIKIQIQ